MAYFRTRSERTAAKQAVLDENRKMEATEEDRNNRLANLKAIDYSDEVQPKIKLSGNREQIAGIAHRVFSRPCPTKKKDDPTSFDGARAYRVLAGVLKKAWDRDDLTVVTGLEKFGGEIGLTKHEGIRDALYDLQFAGLVKFTKGRQDTFGRPIQRGKASVITLLPQTSSGLYVPTDLPELTLDMFRERGNLGSVGWFIAARLWFEWLQTGAKTFDVTRPEVIRLTGVPKSTVYRVFPALADEMHATEASGTWSFPFFLGPIDRTRFSDRLCEAHREWLRARQRNRTQDPGIWLPIPDNAGEFRRLIPLGVFESGEPYWTEEQRLVGPPTCRTRLSDLRTGALSVPSEASPDPEIGFVAEPREAIEVRMTRFWEREASGENPSVTVNDITVAL